MTRQRLSIRVSPSSLAFMTSDGQQVHYERYPLNSGFSFVANMREALRTMPLLHEDYDKVVVSVNAPTMLVPIALFQEQEKETLFHHSFSGQDQAVVVHYVLPDMNAVAVYAVQKDFRTVISDHFRNVRYMPVMAGVWQHLFQKSFTGNRQKLFGHLHDGRLEVISFVQNRFRFCNSYSVGRNAANALYYLLAAWKQLGMDPMVDELHLSGEFDEKKALGEQASQYVKRVFVNNPSGEFNRIGITQIEGIPYDLVIQYVKRIS